MKFSSVILIVIANLFTIISIKGQQDLNIGILIENNNLNIEKVFNKAIEVVNNENSDVKFNGIIANVVDGNTFEVSKKLCKMFKSGIVAVFGPISIKSALHTQSICDVKEMPYIDVRMDFETQLPTINLHPHPNQIVTALRDIVVSFDWKDFAVLYENGDYLQLINEVLESYGPHSPTVIIRRFELNLNGNYRNVLRGIKKSEVKRIIILGSIDTLPELLKQAQQVGIMTDQYQYIIGNLDFHTINLEPYQHSEVNITGFRIISPENIVVKELIKIFENYNENSISNGEFPITLAMGLVFDGVLLLAETFKHILFEPVQLNCNDDKTWDRGFSLVNYIKSSTAEGVSGEIKFDYQGLRTDIDMDVIELTTSGINKIGSWKTNSGLQIQRKSSSTATDLSGRSLVNQSFIVMTALSDPYGMLKETSVKLTGNDQYEGFGIELIHELSKKLGFNYTFRLQEDNAYGSYNSKTGEWNGMIREILDGRAELAITDLTMTSERESAVDFTIPFMNLGIAILYRKPTKEPPKLFSFMDPFSREVWLYLGLGYISVSLSLFILGRLSPTEWDNPYPCIQDPTELENQFTFANSLWFTMGALLQQGSEIAAKAPSTRTIASTWWFFTLIMVSSYTANLAAFLTVESLSTPIESAEDLAAGKGGVKYGAKKGGSTFNFFKEAKYPPYQRMYEFMKENEDLNPSTNAEGVNRVENENYAFLMESTSIEYIIERKCNLTQVGSLLDEKGYGIAMRKNWPYRDALSQALLELQEQGVLTKMKTKWWKEKRGGGACSQNSDQDSAEELGMANLGGVYFVLFVGCCLATCIGILEWLISIYRTSKNQKTSFKNELLAELKFVFKCSGNVKTVQRPKESECDSGSRSVSSFTVDSLPLDNLDEVKLYNNENDIKIRK